MPNDTFTTVSLGGIGVLPTGTAQLPEAERVYNWLMAGIEPELTTDQVPLLKEKYKSESPTKRDQRTKRYTAAFAAYATAFTQYLAALEGVIRSSHVQAMASAENRERGQEEKIIEQLSSSITSA